MKSMSKLRWEGFRSKDSGGAVQDLVEAVLSLMGLKADAIGETDSLTALGIDSMQLVEVWALPS
jgi:acyl carrier protein